MPDLKCDDRLDPYSSSNEITSVNCIIIYDEFTLTFQFFSIDEEIFSGERSSYENRYIMERMRNNIHMS